ncbi:DNA repair protein RecN [Marinomonas mediterranea]|jgi:DNA replication and repair protein RecN|uniref:DNA repair protein RecN n=1 Tax=Marinomonas mediterranea (strain ATCC 700492 / JCM 21426 / NBRC 103028 / MMB-1) TaxID=717774 RepID=F2K0E5_MARM1|nr:DNA repair protein RecN [Marinomonas mediterranea]ADZ89860.1 DNA repair protein RecN [Marinomonas mediterranea MMB-1]WCN12040.1 DNA repair protein RecN [Marinomonas mediterranea]WCN16078.1 DNA repair protein RecN [Marinomonas mediterranea MMB-1]
MLTSIAISNFAIVESLELELKKGMTVISGETGAGKSIMVDALSLCLGGRTDAGVVRHGEKKADISASFDISLYPEVLNWLEEHDLDQEQDCILRRVITKEGRSKAYINSRPCTLSDLKEVSAYLVDIHGQHEHQSLLKKSAQRTQLDAYGQLTELAYTVRTEFNAWRTLKDELCQKMNVSAEQEAKIQLLSYQLEELAQLDLRHKEIEELEQEQAFLSNIAEAQQQAYFASNLLKENDDGNVCSMLHNAIQSASNIQPLTPELESALEMMSEALIQAEEASSSLTHYQDTLEQNPQRLLEVEERLSRIYDTARKHKVSPEALLILRDNVESELNKLQGGEESLEFLKLKEEQAYAQLTASATLLTEKRIQTKDKLASKVEEQIHGLGMPHAGFFIDCQPLDQITANGFEEIEYMIASNPGQPAQPLRKVASGGELSRISLGIQVVTAHTSTIPTLVFDEVDVGISGGIAEVVGRMLRSVGARGQVFCVTHLAQVAAQGHQHFQVSKQVADESTSSQVKTLKEEERTQEIARLLGGIKLTEQTLAHAREMLGNVHLQ